MQRKTQIVNQMFQGVQHLMKQNHIDIFNGTGRILGVQYSHLKVERFP